MANKEIHIGDYVISETSRPYMIAEIGINHNGDINIAKKLMDALAILIYGTSYCSKNSRDGISHGEALHVIPLSLQ